MNKELEKDFLAAELLNNRLSIVSDCFELDLVPKAKFICCNNDLFSILIAQQLSNVLRKQGCEAKLCVSERFEGLIKDNPNAKDWVRFSGKLNDLFVNPAETIFVATQKVAKEKLAMKEYENSYFAIVERFRQSDLSLGTFIESKEAQHGIRRLKNVNFVVCYDDDVTSALLASKLFLALFQRFGKHGPSGDIRKVICVGGKGIMSRVLYRSLMKGEKRKTEGQILKKVCLTQGIPEEVIVVCDNGTNTSQNLNEKEAVIGNKTATVAVTQRLSAILYMSQKQQKPDMKLTYFVIFESVRDTCKYMNGMRFCDGKPILHFWAHVLRRWRTYSRREEPFMVPTYGIDEAMQEAAERLQSKYFVKQQGFAIQSWFQMLPFLADLLFHGHKAMEQYEVRIEHWRKEILRPYAEEIFIYQHAYFGGRFFQEP